MKTKDQLLDLYQNCTNEDLDQFILDQVKATALRTNIFTTSGALNPLRLQLSNLFRALNKDSDFYVLLMDYLYNESRTFIIDSIQNGHLSPPDLAIFYIKNQQILEELKQIKPQ